MERPALQRLLVDIEAGDEDGVGNACDNCPDDYNPGQQDADGDLDDDGDVDLADLAELLAVYGTLCE